MKTIVLILVGSCASLFAGLSSIGFVSNSDQNRENPFAANANKLQYVSAHFSPHDPWRIIDGTTNYADRGWCWFYGKVLEVQPGGIRIEGGYGLGRDVSQYPFQKEFFVRNFPYVAAENETIDLLACYTAKESGVYNYATAIGGSATLRCLDYGKVYTPPPPSPEVVAAAKAAGKAKADASKKTADAAALKSNQAAADKGDAYGLLRMGERYRDGDGVVRDLPTARAYLAKAAAAGSPSAQSALDKLAK